MPLTAKQQRFVEEYLIDSNATQAAIRAGFSKKCAKVIGSENLTKPDIAAAIAAKRSKIAQKAELTAEWVLDRVMRNARVCMGEEAVTISRKQGEELVEMEVKKHDPAGANKALELLSREVNLFTEKTEQTVINRHEDRIQSRMSAINRRRNRDDAAVH